MTLRMYLKRAEKLKQIKGLRHSGWYLLYRDRGNRLEREKTASPVFMKR